MRDLYSQLHEGHRKELEPMEMDSDKYFAEADIEGRTDFVDMTPKEHLRFFRSGDWSFKTKKAEAINAPAR